MKRKLLLAPGLIAALLLTGCAGSSTGSTPSTASSGSNSIMIPDKPDSNPVTLSGYLDTSATATVK